MSATLAAISPPICRYYARGICQFGDMCRFSHDLGAAEDGHVLLLNDIESTTGGATARQRHEDSKNPRRQMSSTSSSSSSSSSSKPSTSKYKKNWANAPVFIPKGYRRNNYGDDSNKSWAEVAGGSSGAVTGQAAGSGLSHIPGGLCPYESNCPFGDYCRYQHIELCEMCDTYCLHPTDQEQRRKHIHECIQQHERDMELSFAIARSKDKTCGICFDTIMEKTGREKRFGILPNCNHIFCLECIRKWRMAKQFEHKITRSCPECRVASDFVCPSAFWVDTKEEKDKLLSDYRSALGVKDCKYFKKGDGKCPFGNKCFYKHALPNGDLVDVGCPKRTRKLHRNTDELIDLLDIYLWDFVDQRDYHWLELLSNATDSDDSDWGEE